MNANELADELKYITKVLNMNTDVDTKPLVEAATLLRQQQAEKEALEQRVDEVKDTNGTLVDLVQLQREEIDMLRQQQAEIEALKNGLSSAYWHDTFVEVKKPNSDLIYRFKLDDVCKHGVDDGACKECYMEAQEK